MFIRVQYLHVGEVSIADSNDDDAERKDARLHNQVDGLPHVVDAAVGEQQYHVVDVEVLPLLNISNYGTQNWAEEGRAPEFDAFETISIGLEQVLESIYFRDVIAIFVKAETEAMTYCCSVLEFRNSTEAK